jgi:hypothetical protein
MQKCEHVIVIFNLLFTRCLFFTPSLSFCEDGLGYHSNGDYDILGMAAKEDEHNHGGRPSAKKSNTGGGNALTKEALKKARKIKAATASSSGEGDSTTGGGGEKTKTMWDFINKTGVATTMNAAAGSMEKKKKQLNNNNNHDDDYDNNDNDDDVATAAVGRGGKDDYCRPTEFGSASNSSDANGRQRQQRRSWRGIE